MPNRIAESWNGLCLGAAVGLALSVVFSVVPAGLSAGESPWLGDRFPDFMLKHRAPVALLGGREAAMEGDFASAPSALRGSGEADSLVAPKVVLSSSSRNAKIIGGSCFVSGIGLCSWGISSWQVREFQECPARNTENVIKIVVGVVLINAGLIFLLGGVD